VVADQVSLIGDPADEARVRHRPPGLHEKRRPDPRAAERIQDALCGARRGGRPIRMLRVEGQRHPWTVIHGVVTFEALV
jgi:hypothetical protein